MRTEEVKNSPCSAPFSHLFMHADVYALVEKYNIQGLKDLASEKFIQYLDSVFTGDEFFSLVEAV